MKKEIIIAFIILALFALTFTGSATAFNTAYSHMSYPLSNAVTNDGKWTSTTEWTDGLPTNFGVNAAFRDKYAVVSSDSGFAVNQYIMIETWDNTNNAGDYAQVCIDGDGLSGSAPQTDDYMINITGHTTATWFKGTGSGWATTAAPASFAWSNSSSSSPTTSANHYVYEINFDKMEIGAGIEPGMRIAVNDAAVGGYGLQVWPPATTADVPSAWGDIPYSADPIPESLNLGLIVALTSVAVIAGSVIFQKRSKIVKFANKTTVA